VVWFIWNDDFLTGTSEIDEQHRRLVALIDEFYGELRKAEPHESLERLLRGLVDYTRYHFATEEGYMRRAGYPRLKEHVAQHAAFVEKIEDVVNRLVKGELVLSLEVTAYLREWLSHHILGVDKELGRFLAAHDAQ
jgi:hemerythrin